MFYCNQLSCRYIDLREPEPPQEVKNKGGYIIGVVASHGRYRCTISNNNNLLKIFCPLMDNS